MFRAALDAALGARDRSEGGTSAHHKRGLVSKPIDTRDSHETPGRGSSAKPSRARMERRCWISPSQASATISIDRRHGVIHRGTTTDAAAHDGALQGQVIPSRIRRGDGLGDPHHRPGARERRGHTGQHGLHHEAMVLTGQAKPARPSHKTGSTATTGLPTPPQMLPSAAKAWLSEVPSVANSTAAKLQPFLASIP